MNVSASGFIGWAEVLARLTARQDLSREEAAGAFEEILAGRAEPSQIAAFVTALATKGETVEEVSGMLTVMRAHAEVVNTPGEILDTCGTGGDRSQSINASTAAALVAAGAGVQVCKHGNRAASSRAGSADVLESLGVVITLGPRGVERCLLDANIGFCFAPRFHPAVRHAALVRQQIGIATVFNVLGPLANPARAQHQVVGVGMPRLAETMLGVLEQSGSRHVMVLYGHDGLDELSIHTRSTVLESYLDANGTRVRRVYEVDPAGLGIKAPEEGVLVGGDAAHNATRVRAILEGERGPQRDFVLLNAAAALVVADVAADLEVALALAEDTIDSGAAAHALDAMVRSSRRAREEGLD